MPAWYIDISWHVTYHAIRKCMKNIYEYMCYPEDLDYWYVDWYVLWFWHFFMGLSYRVYIYIHILSSGYNNTMYNAKYGMMWFTDISIYFYDLLWYIKRCRNTSIRASVEKKWECCGMQFTRPGKLLLRYPCIASIEMLRSRSPPRVQITASSCSSSSSLVE